MLHWTTHPASGRDGLGRAWAARGMAAVNSVGPADIRTWARSHRFNQSGLPYWPWENTPTAGRAGYDPNNDPIHNPQITFKRVEPPKPKPVLHAAQQSPR